MRKFAGVVVILLIGAVASVGFLGMKADAAGAASASALFNGSKPNRANMDVRCGSSTPFTVHGTFRSMNDDAAMLKVIFADGQYVNFPIPANSSMSFTHAVAKSSALNASKVIVKVADGYAAGWLSATRDLGTSSIVCKTFTTTVTPVTFSIGNVTVTEGDAGTKEAILSLTRSGPTTKAVSVSYATSDGTASAPLDYVSKSATVVDFPIGDSTGSAKVVVNGDTINENNEAFNVILSAPSSGTSIADDTGVVSITDDD